MTTLIAALTAAQILIAAPLQSLGTTRADVEKRLGTPTGIGVDYVASPYVEGARDRVVTLSYPKAEVRLYEMPESRLSFLFSYVAAADLLPMGSAVGIGTDHATVLRELGGPFYEDGDQIVYADPRPDAPGLSDRLRLLLKDGRVIGYEWRFAVVPPK
jgi:hypothetical protein